MTQRETRPSASARDDHYYSLLAGVASTRLLESFFDLRLPALLAAGPHEPEAVATALDLHPKRTAKWLLLLEREGLVQRGPAGYVCTPIGAAMYWDAQGDESYFTRDMIDYCRRVSELDFAAVLRGLPLPEAVRWPPRTRRAAEHLERWMSITAGDPLVALESALDWQGVRRLLDVGGGDGTIACALAKAHPDLAITIFNLPASADLARERIAAAGLSERVTVHEGNFLTEDLPGGFDCVQFSRVLADWGLEVCQRLLRLAREALAPGGRVQLCEPFIDRNRALTLSWQFRYVFYDDFAVETYKRIDQYETLLRAAGFSEIRVQDRVRDTIYGVLWAR